MVMFLFLVSLAVAASSQPDSSADAEIIFYSNGSIWKTQAPNAKHALFIGNIFDGSQRIGFVQQKKFLILHLSPGPHTFSVGPGTGKPDPKTQISLELASGKQYFIRAQGESKGVPLFTNLKNRLDLVTCETAQKEAGGFSPTEVKHIAPELKGRIVSGSSLSPCR